MAPYHRKLDDQRELVLSTNPNLDILEKEKSAKKMIEEMEVQEKDDDFTMGELKRKLNTMK